MRKTTILYRSLQTFAIACRQKRLQRLVPVSMTAYIICLDGFTFQACRYAKQLCVCAACCWYPSLQCFCEVLLDPFPLYSRSDANHCVHFLHGCLDISGRHKAIIALHTRRKIYMQRLGPVPIVAKFSG